MKDSVPVSNDVLFQKVPSKYKLVILAAKRALELSEGAPRLTADSKRKPALAALQEIADGKIGYKLRKPSKK